MHIVDSTLNIEVRRVWRKTRKTAQSNINSTKFSSHSGKRVLSSYTRQLPI